MNDAPVNTVPGGQTVAEDTILPIAGVSVADIDSSALTTTLNVSSGKLNVTAGTGAVVTDNGTASVTITGTAAQINAALAGLAYTGNLNFNGADTLTVVTNDGTATDTDTIAITVNAVNDPPALNLDLDSSTIGGVDYLTTFTDGGPAVAIVDTDVSVIDNDSPTLASATVTLTNPDTDDVLEFNGLPPGSIIVAGSGSSAITLSGAASAADYQTALQQITFDNTGTNPSTETRIIDVIVNDGTADSNIAHAIVEVTQVDNTAPVVDLDFDNSTVVGTSFRATFTEGGAPIPIADVDTSITDLDSTHLESATITLTNAQTGDLLAVSGTLPGLITTVGYDSGTGVLTLTGHATLDEYEAALQQILYSNTSDDPATEDRLIEVVVNDGANNSQAVTALLTVVAVNDAPALVVADATYQENAAPVLLSPSASLTDADDTELNFAAVRITAGSFAGDGDTLTANGATSGVVNGITFTWNPTLHALVLTGASSVANYQALLQTVAFQSTSDNPTDFDASPQRTLTWSVSDGTAVTTATTTLDITAVNDAPVLDLDADDTTTPGVDYLTAFTDGGPAVAIVDTDVLITDSDDTELTSATVTLTNPDTDDVLVFSGTPPAGITASAYNAGTGILTLTGTASLAAYQTALRQITFDNTGTNPSTDTRIIDVVVNDGTVASNLAQASIVVTQVDNTAPVVDLDANDSTAVGTSFSATFTEGGVPIPIADIDTLITDADSTTLASATIKLTDPQAGDLLTATLPLPGGITASVYNPVTGTLTLSNVASLADYETALEAIRFSVVGENPVAGSRIGRVAFNRREIHVRNGP